MSNEPSENWDDDFLFQISDPTRTDRNLSYDNPETTNISRSTTHIMPHDSSENTTRSRFSINSAAWEDPEAGPSKPPPLHEHDTRPTPNLPPWSEATVPHMFANDEFSPSGGRDLDRTVTTRRKGKQTQFATASASSLANPSDKSWAEAPDDGMYDRDFEDEPVSTDNDNRAPSVASTSSSNRLGPYRDSRQQSSSSLQLPASFIRARSNTPTHRPTSPSASTFSTLQMSSPVPSHLALIGQGSARPFISPPPTSPQRPRRRLRKKSRPQDVDSHVFEMIPETHSQNFHRPEYGYLDEEGAEQLLFEEVEEDRPGEAPSPTLVPPRPISPSTMHLPVLSPSGPTFPSISPPSSPPSKTPLLSRLGSVRRWRSRRSSTASKDISIDTSMETTYSSSYAPPKTPEPSFSRSATPSSPSSSRNWLFRVSPGTKITPVPDLQRENSKTSRFGRRRSTTTEQVLMEEDEEPSEKNKGKARAKGVVSRITNHAKTAEHKLDSDLTPRQSSTALSKRGSDLAPRRPLSLQPQSKATTSQAVVGWAASVGRSTSNPFVMAKSKENARASDSDGGQSLDSTKKRLPNSAHIKRQGHKRSLSLTSDPDEVNMSRPVASVSASEAPPPVPPLPPGVASASSSSSALPPIALSPPSPPKLPEKSPHNRWNNPTPPSDLLSPSTPPPSPSVPTFNGNRLPGNKGSAPPSPGQSLSLGRGTQHHQSHLLQEVAASASSNFDRNAPSLLSTSFSTGHLRRSSLGDLKIPPRISMAQTGLKNNLGMVREFANKVEELQQLREVHLVLLNDLGRSGGPMIPSDRSLPVFTAVDRVERHYALWWECADLLVELGGSGESKDKDGSLLELGPSVSPVPNGDAGDDDPTITGDTLQPVKSPPKASPSTQWRASTGRHDLSGRQLILLKEMLATPDPSAFNQHHSSSGLRFASQPVSTYATASAVTLPSIPPSPVTKAGTDSSLTSDSISPAPKEGKRRFQRVGLIGLNGIRDMLRSLTNKPPLPSPAPTNMPPSSSSLSSASDADAPGEGRKQHRKRRSTDAKGTINSASVKHGNSPYNPLHDRKSPRRPSLASIFRIGQSHSNGVTPASTKSKNGGRKGVELQHAYPNRPGTSSTTEEDEDYSDWDRMDSTSDVEVHIPPLSPGAREATVKGRRQSRRNLRKRPATAHGTTKTASQVSFLLQDSPELKRQVQPSADSYSLLRPILNANHSSTVRSAPNVPLSDFRLALTPENIRPQFRVVDVRS